MREKAPRNTWYTPKEGVSHYHTQLGIPICGNGWFSGGKAVESKPSNACKGCVKKEK